MARREGVSERVTALLFVIGILLGSAAVYGGASAYLVGTTTLTATSTVTTTVSTTVTGWARDELVGQPISSSDLAALKQLSAAPYGPSGAPMLSSVQKINGSQFVVDGKSLMLYVGADFCPFCAAQQWPMVLALERFGDFSGLRYMTSSLNEGDYVTFTLHGSSYSSNYIVLQGYEQEDRYRQPLDAVPSNYTTIFSQYGSAYPFMDFGNKYVVRGSMVSADLFANKNWTDVFNDIMTGTPLGTQIEESANVITALVCKLTNNQPSSVCAQNPINGLLVSLASYAQVRSSSALMATPSTSERRPWSS